MEQNEISKTLYALDDSGFPQNFGWARQPHLYYEPLMIAAPGYRISESDRYIIHSPTHLLVFEIRDDAWLGYMGISVISLRDKKRSTQLFKTYFPMGSYELPSASTKGSARWRRKKTHLDFIFLSEGVKIIKTNIPKFGRHRSMRGELVLSEPSGAESLVTNQPWRSDKYTFKYSLCSPWYNVEGIVQFGGTEIIFTKGNGWGIFDWNRCVRPKTDIRYMAAACGMYNGNLLSFCVGYSFADFSLGTENGFFVDGKLHKLNQITFHIPMSDWLSPWRFTSDDNRLEMTFIPHQERLERRRLLFHHSARRQVFGFFSGKVRLDDGHEIEFQGLTGFAERCRTRY